jgi:hypothetical protein
LEIRSHFWPKQPGLQSSYFKLSSIAGIIGTYHHTQLLVEIGYWELLPKLASNHNPWDLTLQSAGHFIFLTSQGKSTELFWRLLDSF